MIKKRASLTVEWDLDFVPGWNDNPHDLAALLQRYLDGTIPHYNPTVKVNE